MKLNNKRTVLVGLAFMSICAFWQIFDNVIPLILENTFGLTSAATGAIMGIDNILALFMLPLFGMLSDKTRSRMGRRMPYIVYGTLVAVVCVIMLPVAQEQKNFALFMVTVIVLLVAMATYRSPAVALMPDVTIKPLRSKANAIINLMGAIGGAAMLGITPLLVVDGNDDYFLLFITLAAFMLVCVCVLFFTIKERSCVEQMRAESEAYGIDEGSDAASGGAASGGAASGGAASGGAVADAETKAEADAATAAAAAAAAKTAATATAAAAAAAAEAAATATAKMDLAVRKSFFLILASIFLWFMGYNAVTTGFTRYAENVWDTGLGNASMILMVAQVAAIISYIPVGIIATKVGRRKTILAGIAMLTVAFGASLMFTDFSYVMFAFFALAGIAWAFINVNSYPMVVEMSKGANIGKYTGYYYVFSMAAQSVTPFFSGLFVDNLAWGWRTLFPYGAIFVALSFVTMFFVRHGDSRPVAPISKLEAYDTED